MVAAKLIDIKAEGRQHVDRYELVAEIASGGMATVYLARLSGVGGFQRFVAIKRLHPHLANDPEFVQMFLDEARLAAGIHHPNVVPILEVGASDRGYYLVMDYIEGDTLARLLARSATMGNTFPVSIGLRIMIDTLSGVHAAHELRDERGQLAELVHRDVSPQNILVGLDGVSRISDFGVARAQSRVSSTRAGQLKGKIAYMAPEQASGTPIDRRADVFAAGIVLWEILAGQRLFKAENEVATLGRVLSDRIESPRTHARNLPASISQVVMRALERDPDKRYATCAEFADALEGATAQTALVQVAPPREVAAYVAEVIGHEIAQQREAVRGWLARSEPSRSARPLVSHAPGISTTTASVAAMSVPRYDEITAPAGKGRSAVPPPQPAARARWFMGGILLAVTGLSVALYLSAGRGSAVLEGNASQIDSAHRLPGALPAPCALPSPSVRSPGAVENTDLDAGPATSAGPVESAHPPSVRGGPMVPAGPGVTPLVDPKMPDKSGKRSGKPEDSDDWLRNPYR